MVGRAQRSWDRLASTRLGGRFAKTYSSLCRDLHRVKSALGTLLGLLGEAKDWVALHWPYLLFALWGFMVLLDFTFH